MTKLTLSDPENLQNELSATTLIANNNAATIAAVENTLSRDGTAPNQMEAVLDMNSNKIINLPEPTLDHEPVRLAEFNVLSASVDSSDLEALVEAAEEAAEEAEAASESAEDAALSAADSLAGIAATLDGVVHFDAAQSKTSGEKLQARDNIGLGTMSTQSSGAVAITGGTITGLGSPSANSDVATKAYVDANAAGLRLGVAAAKYATAAVLPNSPTYANGTLGVGATLTAGSNAAIAVDSVSPVLNDRILVKNQAAPAQNGLYYVSTVGSGAAAWVLTRVTDFDTAAEMLINTYIFVTAGSANANSGWTLAATVTTVGTTACDWNQFSAGNSSSWAISGSNIYNSNVGFVGIGTSSPSVKLTVQKAAGPSSTQEIYSTDGTQWLSANSNSSSGSYSPIVQTGDHSLIYSDGTPNTGALTIGQWAGSARGLRLDSTGGLAVATLGAYGIPVIGTSGTLGQAKIAMIAPGVAGVTGAGSVDDRAAINTMIGNSSEVWFAPGTYKISSDITFAAGKVYRFCAGAQLSVDTTKTVTILGVVEGPLKQIFAGAGSVVGIRKVYPEWFGALNDATANDVTALQKAHDCAEAGQSSDGGICEILLSRGAGYRINSTWFIRPRQQFPLRIRGAGCTETDTTIIAKSGGNFSTGGNNGAVWVKPRTYDTGDVVDFCISDLQIRNENNANDYRGLVFGGSGGTLGGFHHGATRFENIRVEGFGTGIRVSNVRYMFGFRSSIWCSNYIPGAVGLIIQGEDNDSRANTGDSIYRELQIVNHKDRDNGGGSYTQLDQTCLYLYHNAGGNSGIQANQFDHCTFYAAGGPLVLNGAPGYVHGIGTCVKMRAENGNGISNTWFDRCEFEGEGKNALHCSTDTASRNYGIFINNSYIATFWEDAVMFIGSAAYNLYQIQITGNKFTSMYNRPLYIKYTQGLTLSANNFQDVAGQPTNEVIYCESVKHISIVGNNHWKTAGSSPNYFVRFAADGNYLRVLCNAGGEAWASGPVSNPSSGGNWVFDHNG